MQWTAPANGARVKLAVLLAGADATGNYYYPVVQAQFSEAVDPASVNGGTVIVTDAAGRQVAADVRYDSGAGQVQLLLREAPQVNKGYSVSITSGVKDLRGNPLAANYTWGFTITSVGGQGDAPNLYLPVIARQ